LQKRSGYAKAKQRRRRRTARGHSSRFLEYACSHCFCYFSNSENPMTTMLQQPRVNNNNGKWKHSRSSSYPRLLNPLRLWVMGIVAMNVAVMCGTAKASTGGSTSAWIPRRNAQSGARRARACASGMVMRVIRPQIPCRTEGERKIVEQGVFQKVGVFSTSQLIPLIVSSKFR